MTIISQLKAMLTSDTGDFEMDMKAAAATAKDFNKTAKETEGASKQAGAGVSKIDDAFGKLVTGAAIIAAGTALVNYGKEAVAAYEESARAEAQLEAVLRSTGGAAGMTAEELGALATAKSEMLGIDDDLIKKNEALLLTFTQIGRDVFPDTMQAALDMSAVMGQSLQSSIVLVGKALNDPIQGLTALRRVGVAFDDEQEKMIKGLAESGDLMGAQKLVLAEMQKEFGGAAKSMHEAGSGSDSLGVAIGNLTEEIGRGLMPATKAANTEITGIAKTMTDQIKIQNDVREALRNGVITQEEFNQVYNKATHHVDDYKAAEDLLKHSLYGEAEAAIAALPPVKDLMDGHDLLAGAADEAAAAIRELAEAQKKEKDAILGGALKAIDDMNISIADQIWLKDKLALASGAITEKQKEENQVMYLAKEALENGQITREQYYDWVLKLSDGLLTASEMAQLVYGAIVKIPSTKDVHINIWTTEYYTSGGERGAGGGAGGQSTYPSKPANKPGGVWIKDPSAPGGWRWKKYGGSYASGGSFIVPGSGGQDQPYLLGLKPGEQVDVSPPGQTFNGGGDFIFGDINVFQRPGENSAAFAARLKRDLMRSARSLAAGAGYSG